MLGCAPREKQPDPETYKKDIEKWRADRLSRLKSPDGWLNLAGLFWLREGENTIGSGTLNTILFPEGAPDLLRKDLQKRRQPPFRSCRGYPGFNR